MPDVTMEDGATIGFGEKAKAKKLSSVDPEGAVHVRFAFSNGEYRSFTMAPEHKHYARSVQHGLDQKFGDAYAGATDVEDCIIAFEQVAKQLTDGDWRETREGDGMAGISVLAKALVEITGKTIEEVKTLLSTCSNAEKQTLRKTEPVASVVARLEAQKATKSKVDVSALMGKLGVIA